MTVGDILEVLKDEDLDKEVFLYNQETAETHEIDFIDTSMEITIDINFN